MHIWCDFRQTGYCSGIEDVKPQPANSFEFNYLLNNKIQLFLYIATRILVCRLLSLISIH